MNLLFKRQLISSAKAGTLVAAFSLVLFTPSKVNAYTVEGVQDVAFEKEMISLVGEKTSDPIVLSEIDDFDGDGKLDAVAVTSACEDNIEIYPYSLWYISNGTVTSFENEHKDVIRNLGSYTISGQKMFYVATHESAVNTMDEIYYVDKTGIHYIDSIVSTYEEGGYLVSAVWMHGMPDLDYSERQIYTYYKYENGKFIEIDGQNEISENSNDLSTSTNAITDTSWYKKYSYSLDPVNKTILLESYNGNTEYVFVKNNAIIDGITYQTKIAGDLFKDNTTIKAVSFGQGCKVVDSYLTFENAENLEYINFYGLDTSDVESLENMFGYCYNLKEIKLGGLNTSKVNTMASMFGGCTSLKSINMSGLDFSSLTKAEGMFAYSSFEELTLTSKLGCNTELPYFYVVDNNYDGIADSSYDYKVITKDTKPAHYIKKDTPTNSFSSGAEYECGRCHLVKQGEDYYIYPDGDYTMINSRYPEVEEIDAKDGIKIAKDALVGVATDIETMYYEYESYSIEFNYEYFPFYEKVDELLENGHWSEKEQGGDVPIFSFESHGNYCMNMAAVTLNSDREIVLIKDYYCE